MNRPTRARTGGRRDNHNHQLLGLPARHVRMEMRGTRFGGNERHRRRFVDDAGRIGEAPQLRRGPPVLVLLAGPRSAAAVRHRRLDRGPRLGVALRGGRRSRAAARRMESGRHELAVKRGRSVGIRWRARPTRPTHMVQWRGTEPALDPCAHDRGIRAPQRPRRPVARVRRRQHGRIEPSPKPRAAPGNEALDIAS